MKLSDAITAYKICAKAEGKSPRTIGWVTSSVGYLAKFLGGDPEISSITADDFRRFIIALQATRKFNDHPYNKPQEGKLSPQSIETYCRAIRAFFGETHFDNSSLNKTFFVVLIQILYPALVPVITHFSWCVNRSHNLRSCHPTPFP